MRKITYDVVIPLGDRCSCTQNLKHYGLRPVGYKLPFDWVKRGTFDSRIGIILNNFNDFLVPERLRQVHYIRIEQWNLHRFYDTKTKLVFAHDFPKNMKFEDSFRVAFETYMPKIKRYKEIFFNRKKVLLVYMTDVHVPDKLAKIAMQKLRQKFGYDDIDLLIVENGVRTMWRYKKQSVAHGITRIKTKVFLMPIHYADVTPAQFKILDKIFHQIRCNPIDFDENNPE